MFLFVGETVLFSWQISMQTVVETFGLTNLLFTRDSTIYSNLNIL